MLIAELYAGHWPLRNTAVRPPATYRCHCCRCPQAWLDEKDPTRKRYYACHCPLARTSIISGKPGVLSLFCYCSAGFEKLPFDVIFGEPVKVEVLKSALGGSNRCRFAITVPERFRKNP